jgi:DNA-binding response OmpR family regulator
MNGLEMLSSLRELTKVPVIVHSFDEQYKEQALELGADDFILKPFAPDKLLDKIHRLIS